MKTLYFECNMGAAGDMLMASLLELHPNPEDFLRRLNALNIPGVVISAVSSMKCGISGTHMNVLIHGEEENEEYHQHEHHHHHDRVEPDHDHDHDHHHDHEHHDHDHHHIHDEHHNDHEHHEHSHAGMGEIEHLIHHLDLPQNVVSDALAIYKLIADAESKAHQKPVDQVHFHEVGAMDAVADIVGVCLLIHELKPDLILASPIHVGSGHVKCAHGILPVPAPATATILQGVPIYGGQVKGELCTPTGAALLKHFAKEFGPMPMMTVTKIGYGMGKKDFPAANCVRAFIGETADMKDDVVELVCNLDDMSAESIGFAMERLLENGALDVYLTPIVMKKSRPATQLACLCKPQDKDKMAALLFKHTSTIGIRFHGFQRYTLDRSEEIVHTDFGDIRFKKSTGYGVERSKPEYDDLAKLAKENGLSIEEIRARIK